jgi:DNA-binding PadR family transcriptional regulator
MHRHGPHPGRGRDFLFNAMSPRGHHPRGGWGGPGEWGDPRAMGGMRRRRMRRGDVRAALLVLLDEQPHTGYSAMEELERRSNGAWRPSPGSVYPTLQQLEDEGLIRQEAGEGRTPFTLTDEGKAHVADHREELGEPWAKSSEGIGEERLELRGLIAQIAAAAFQVGQAGDDAQVTRAKELLADARRGLYKILADDDEPEA